MFDLGKPNQFHDYSILIGLFYQRPKDFDMDIFKQKALRALEEKGFNCKLVIHGLFQFVISDVLQKWSLSNN